MLIPFSHLFKKYRIAPTGILHIGASTGQEMEAYAGEGVRNVIFVEAIPKVFRALEQRMRAYPETKCLHACISDTDGAMVDFHISNNEGQSSSLFEFGTHTQEHPTVRFTDHIRLQTVRVDSLLKQNGIEAGQYDFINIDLQGAELLALRGMDLSHVRYAYIEVNEKELYQGCPLIGEIDAYLKEAGLERVEMHMTPHGWGDAFYMRKDKRGGMIPVPKHFQPAHPSKYPKDNVHDFESWYLQNYSNVPGRYYLPIMWTAYYCKNKYGQDAGALGGLQNFLKTLDRSLKYYTIVQYDDGILNNLDGLDIKVFSMSGKPMDYALPLLCTPHAELPPQPRPIFANFIGRITHPIREKLIPFVSQRGWMITDKAMPLSNFCSVLNTSIFTLCPRGYGPTSFRIMEALQYGSIPVYISDEFIEPHGLPFDFYGVKVSPEEVKDLKSILDSVPIPMLQSAGKQVYQDYYTYESNKRIIDYQATL
jgi:FkbM family methyltransferase